MQQVLKRMTLTAVSSTIQHLEHLNLQRLAFASLWCTGKDNNYFVKNELIKQALDKCELLLIDKHEAKAGCSWSFKRSLFRSGRRCNFSSDIGQQKRFFTTQASSFSLCCRNLSTICPSHCMLNMSSVSNHIKRNLWDIFKRNHFGDYVVLENVEEVCESGHVPSHIRCPPYAKTGHPLDGPRVPEVKAEWQVEAMRESCHLARSIMNTVGETIQAGMTTEDIDALVHKRVIESGAYPSPLNYRGFPKSVCTSVNNVACHGIPNKRRLVDGDIVSVDITVFSNGYHGDCCETYLIGNVDEAGMQLVNAARRCRDEAIAICGPGVPFSDIGAKIEETAKMENVTLVPCFTGHGIGQYFHGPPDIYHCYNDYPGTMEEGMTFTIEPIVAQGSEEVIILEDGWTAVMLDNGRAAQFEHTILITCKGNEILTQYH
ncbi:methionine aminopeptidase 1D, mitochondrial isoform X2 [Macrobrachium rosenbergii]|uniref:methionine aminopeptidase 1D, mitochondrial isoform X2 n=1 Tax=Macrobrachium rosenbergii TaxID=79674 RepID=UPI0034D4B0DC